MPRRQKKGNYSVEDRKLILHAATSVAAGRTTTEKQQWLLQNGVHRPGFPNEAVSESAIKYWSSAHRRIQAQAQANYEETMKRLLTSPSSSRALKEMLAEQA